MLRYLLVGDCRLLQGLSLSRRNREARLRFELSLAVRSEERPNELHVLIERHLRTIEVVRHRLVEQGGVDRLELLLYACEQEEPLKVL